MMTTVKYRTKPDELRAFLDRKVAEFNRPSFIPADPVSVPHSFSRQQDIEIAGFFAAVFSWGNRTTIIRKSRELMQRMDGAPWQFVLHHSEKELRRLLDFKHRTFNPTDLLYFIEFFRHHYSRYETLEDAFLPGIGIGAKGQASEAGTRRREPRSPWEAGAALSAFHHYFFSLEESPGAFLAPPRTRKHIATPERNSSCKRLNMFLRWMVRKDDKGVDFGLWRRIPMASLVCPLDLHVARVATRLGLLVRTPADWQAAQQLTHRLSLLDPADPVKYDFALFGLGVLEKF